MSGDALRSILDKLKKSPADFAVRRSAAEALERTLAPGAARGELDAVLAGFVNLTGHDDDVGLPCLCRDCLATAGDVAEASGMKFYRSFAIAGTRVLHFWMLEDVAPDRAHVRRSVEASLVKRLVARKETT